MGHLITALVIPNYSFVIRSVIGPIESDSLAYVALNHSLREYSHCDVISLVKHTYMNLSGGAAETLYRRINSNADFTSGTGVCSDMEAAERCFILSKMMVENRSDDTNWRESERYLHGYGASSSIQMSKEFNKEMNKFFKMIYSDLLDLFNEPEVFKLIRYWARVMALNQYLTYEQINIIDSKLSPYRNTINKRFKYLSKIKNQILGNGTK